MTDGRIDTEVVDAGDLDGRPWVILASTILRHESGGQPADRGTVAGVAVNDVREIGGRVLHLVERPVAIGPAAVELDLARRRDLSEQHTAQHLLTAVLLERHGLPTTSFHLGETYTAIEIDGPVPSRDAILGFEDEANALVREGRQVRIRWCEIDEMEKLGVRSRGLPEGLTGKMRLVEIDGVDLNTCGGTHVGSLAELHAVHILGAEPARGGTRIRFVAGGRVIGRLRTALALEDDLKGRLSTSPGEFATALDGWQAQIRDLKKRVRDLETERAGSIARELSQGACPAIGRFLPGAGMETLRAVAAAVAELRPDAVVALVGEASAGGPACFLVQSGPAGPADVSAAGARVRQALGAKGGGRGRTFQGQGGAWRDAIDLVELVQGA